MGIVLHTSPKVDALDNPMPSGQKRLAAWANDPTPEPTVVPALDVAALRAKYGPERGRAPRMKEGTFRVPLDTRWDMYERIRNERVNLFVNEMARMGWDVDTSQRIQVYPGIHPAIDMATQKPLIGLREFVVRAWFVFRNPEVRRLEVNPEWLTPLKVA